jgi:hypothetical protein
VNLDPFIYWIKEREAIRISKEVNHDLWPWTDDLILRKYSFCNVRREDDRVTRWIKANIREPYADHPHLWWMCCAARQINWPTTLQALIDARAWPTVRRFRPEAVTEVIEAISKRGEKWHTGAYMIRAESDKRVPWFVWSKARYIAEIVLGRLWRDRQFLSLSFTESLQKAHAALMLYCGWGPFMAFQAIIDMAFTPILADAPDRNTWFASGPGTLRGLNRLHERPVKRPLSQKQALEELREVYPLLIKESQVNFDWLDSGNVMCEVEKYLRVQNGEGRPRALYRPREV